MSLYQEYLKTDFATIHIEADNEAITSIRFVQDGRILDSTIQKNIITDNCAKQLTEYFAGVRRAFNFPYKLSGNDFQNAVWSEIAKIPYGKTISYKELANRLNKPQVSKAVEAAVNENFLFLCIPCHRIVNNDGSVGKFTAGIKLKEQLLELEKEPEAYTKYNYLELQKNRGLPPSNLISGRFLFKTGDILFETEKDEILTPHKAHVFPVGLDFSSSSGFTLEANAFMANEYEPLNEPQDITLTFYNASDTFITKTILSPGQNILNFDINDMPFKHVYKISIFSKKSLKDIRIHELNVCDNYFRYKGQSAFYTPIASTLKEEDYTLSFSFNGKGGIESPILSNTPNSVFNVKLPIRNTIFIVIKNLSTAKKLRLFYKTSTFDTYTDDNFIELNISQKQDYIPYYFNLSNTPGLKNVPEDCYLTQFKLEASGKGEIIIKEYSFEEEKSHFDNSGKILSCLCENNDILIKGTIFPEYANNDSLISIYETSPTDEKSTVDGKKHLLSVPVSDAITSNDVDGSVCFSVSGISIKKDNITRLSSQFTVFLENGKTSIPLGDRFFVENYEDFESNPYDFKLPEFTVTVTDSPFFAKGDAFSDDTEAIQLAIDSVWKQGGGKVIIPGTHLGDSESTLFYGRRYRITNLLLRSRVELHLENGAVLWQSPIFRDYKYSPIYGHDFYINSENKTFASYDINLPTIQCFESEYVKITGHGMIRSVDIGTDISDKSTSPANACPNRIHQVPLGFYKVKNIELKDFELIRTNSSHISLHSCSRIYAANIKMHEVRCANGIGFELLNGTHHAVLNRNIFVSNDSGVVFSGCYNNPSGRVWWKSRLGIHSGTRHIKVCHSYINSLNSKALAFKPWGTDDSNYEMQEISGISAFDNQLIGMYSVGVCSDNPYVRKNNFENTSRENYSPIKSVRIYGNIYEGKATLASINATDFLTDISIHSADNFQNRNFCISKIPNLSNWSYKLNRNRKSISVKNINGKYAGVMRYFREGDTALFQGISLKAGAHKCTFEILTGETGAFIFIQNIRTGEILSERHILSLDNFNTFEIKFRLASDADLFIGIRHPADMVSDDDFTALKEANIESVEY